MIIDDPEELQLYIDFMMKEKFYDNVDDLIDDLKYEYNIQVKNEQISSVEWHEDLKKTIKNEC